MEEYLNETQIGVRMFDFVDKSTCNRLDYIPKEDLCVLVVGKPFDADVDKVLDCVVKLLEQNDITFYVQASLDPEQRESILLEKINRIITLGGDGTILYAVKMFYNRDLPPLISFSLGSVGHLCRYDSANYESVLINCLLKRCLDVHRNQELQQSDDLLSCPTIDYRSRLEVKVDPKQYGDTISVNSGVFKQNQKDIDAGDSIYILNEITISSETFSKNISLDIYINDRYLTKVEAYGLILATPTGSTAYSMSSGGCMVCTTVDSISITPMNPTSLSFRPLVLPHDCEITIEVTSDSNI